MLFTQLVLLDNTYIEVSFIMYYKNSNYPKLHNMYV
jgi:hypothetical protein